MGDPLDRQRLERFLDPALIRYPSLDENVFRRRVNAFITNVQGSP